MVSAAQPALPWLDRPVTASGPTQALDQTEPETGGFHPFGEDGFSFLDLIDVVNPLQHIPVIGPMYRDLTGDTIDPLPRITGSTLFFGPIGAGLAAADVVLKETTGKDTGAHVLAMLRDNSTTQTAEAGPVAAAGTDGDDPVTAWLQAETAYRTKQLAARDSSDTGVGRTPPNPTATSANRTPAPPVPAAGPADAAIGGIPGDDPVLAWARAEAAYRSAIATRSTPVNAVTGLAVKAPTDALTETATAPLTTETMKSASPDAALTASGATAPTGGWFSEVMLGALARYESSRNGDGERSESQTRRHALN